MGAVSNQSKGTQSGRQTGGRWVSSHSRPSEPGEPSSTCIPKRLIAMSDGMHLHGPKRLDPGGRSQPSQSTTIDRRSKDGLPKGGLADAPPPPPLVTGRSQKRTRGLVLAMTPRLSAARKIGKRSVMSSHDLVNLKTEENRTRWRSPMAAFEVLLSFLFSCYSCYVWDPLPFSLPTCVCVCVCVLLPLSSPSPLPPIMIAQDRRSDPYMYLNAAAATNTAAAAAAAALKSFCAAAVLSLLMKPRLA